MESLFGPDELLNETSASLVESTRHIYTAEEVSLMLAALGAMVASIVYSFKHIKSSSCLGSKCTQEVETVVIDHHVVDSSEV